MLIIWQHFKAKKNFYLNENLIVIKIKKNLLLLNVFLEFKRANFFKLKQLAKGTI